MNAETTALCGSSDAAASGSLLQHALRQLEAAQSQRLRPCKVCSADSPMFDVLDFGKTCERPTYLEGPVGLPVYYRRCQRCAFIFTEFCDDFTPDMWTGLLYNPTYYQHVDPDYADVRPRGNAAAVDALLCDRRADWMGLDYGGGNGATRRHLRELGYSYDTHDPFGISDVSAGQIGRYNFCSTFEVAEHTPDPRGFMAEIVQMCSTERLAVLVGTHVHDRRVEADGNLAWWYAAPRNGHISLHSQNSLAALAKQFSLSCLSFTENTHLITRGYTAAEARCFLFKGKLRGRLRAWLRRQPAVRPTPPPGATT